jgi:acyl carrier protein
MKVTIFETIRDLLTEILDVDPSAIRPDTYLMRDLEAESIDLLELAVALNTRFGVEVEEETLFLRHLRELILEGRERGGASTGPIAAAFPFLSRDRIMAMVDDLEEGPVLQVADLDAYIRWRQGGDHEID